MFKSTDKPFNRVNLEDSIDRLAEFIQWSINDLENDVPNPVVWLIQRKKDLGSFRKLAAVMVAKLEENDGISHEFRLNNADLKLHLEICDDSFVRGYVTYEYESSKDASTLLWSQLDIYGLLKEGH